MQVNSAVKLRSRPAMCSFLTEHTMVPGAWVDVGHPDGYEEGLDSDYRPGRLAYPPTQLLGMPGTQLLYFSTRSCEYGQYTL